MLRLRRAFKNIWRSKIRTLLVSLVLALCVAVFVSTLAGVDASESTTKAMIEEYAEAAEATIEEAEQLVTAINVIGKPTMSSAQAVEEQDLEEAVVMEVTSSTIDEDIVDDISTFDGVEAVVPEVMESVGEIVTEESQSDFDTMMVKWEIEYIILGVPLDPSLDEQYHILPANIVDGRSLEEGDDDAVLIGEELTDYFEAGVGDIIDIEGTDFEVVGVYSSSIWEKDVYMSLSSAQDLLDLEGKVTSLLVYAESVSAVDDIVAEIQSAYPDLLVFAYKDISSGSSEHIQHQQERMIARLNDDLSRIQTLGFNITLVSGIIGALLIFGLMFYTVRERTKEIGTLKALGVSNPDIMKQFMFEGLFIGLIGGAIGLGIAAVASSLFSSLLLSPGETLGTSISVSITLFSMLLGLGVAAIAAALGSLYPAWRASRISPMESLRHE